MTAQTSVHAKWNNLLSMFAITPSTPASCHEPEQSEETRKAEKDVFDDMMWSHPEVFTSELHAHYMMYAGHGRR